MARIVLGHAERLRVVEPVVDSLPEELWRPGNLYSLPGGDWRFCVGDHPQREGRSAPGGADARSLGDTGPSTSPGW